VQFEVVDTGIGIAPGPLARLFQPFSQADTSTTRRYGGTGLGLAISKRLVEAMGGTIGVESEPGRGSRFWFTIEAPAAGTAADPGPTGHPDALRSRRVLVADDRPIGRSIVGRQLAAWGARVDEAPDGDRALARLRASTVAERPEIVVLSLSRAAEEGLGPVRRALDDPALGRTPIVLLAPAGHVEIDDRLREAGVVACLTRPVRPTRLFAALVRGLQAAPASEEPSVSATLGAPSDAATPCRALRILVAEDNRVNQIVIVRMLEKAGHHVSLAANGREAVDAVAREAYDLVMMDCQMPELDGFEASRAIRAGEAGTARHIPIVALTANATQGDRDRCLAAGMDDYLTKPVTADRLVAALARWGSASA
jgi:two-component system, sensor histidine kinase and response regulator